MVRRKKLPYLVLCGAIATSLALVLPGGALSEAASRRPIEIGDRIEGSLALEQAATDAEESLRTHVDQRLAADDSASLRGQVRSAAGVEWGEPPLVIWSSLAERPARLETRAEGGAFRFETGLAVDAASVVVALHERHLPACATVVEGCGPVELLVEPADPITVEVVTPDGDPVEGATVRCRADLPVAGTTADLPIELDHRTNRQGRAALYPLPDAFELSASANGARSELWYGSGSDAGPVVRLVLHATFGVSGRVLSPPNGCFDGYRVHVRTAQRGFDSPSFSLEVDEAGHFAAAAVPWPGPGEYVLRLEGADLCPLERVVTVERAGESVEVSLECRRGIPTSFLALDEHDVPVASARVMPYWWEDGRWVFGGSEHTDEHGVARFEHLLPGSFGARTSLTGFVDAAHGPWDVVAELEGPLALSMQTAGRVTGRVTANGRPVTDFEVRAWTGTGSQIVERFHDREDGRFELDRVPNGELTLHAWTEACPPSAPQVVDVKPSTGASVELTLDEGRAVSGQVLDVSTGLPISGATVQVWSTTSQGHSLGAWGTPRTSGLDGRFDGIVAPVQDALLAVRADGYEELLVRDVREEVGSIGLSRLQTLTVQLSAPRGVDLTTFRVRADTDTTGELVAPSSDGVAAIPSTDAGMCRVNVFPPAGGRIELDVDLAAGREWRVEVPVATGRWVVVSVAPGPGSTLPEVMWINGVFAGPSGTYSTYLRVDPDGRAEFPCASGSRAVFEVLDATGHRLATRSVPIGDERLVTVPITVEPHCVELQLVDADDRPLPHAFVSTWMTEDPLGFHQNTWTDERGRLTVCDFGSGLVSLFVSTTSLQGRERQLDLHRARGDDLPLVVRVDASAGVWLRLLEGGLPASGVRTGLRPHGITNVTKHRVSDPSGDIRYAALEAGTYEVNVQGNGWWPMTFDVEASATPAPLEVHVRRRGSLRFEVTQAGLPVTGARVSLRSARADDDVEAWVERGLIQVVPGVGTTDISGALEVQGLPSGSFSWTVLSTEGAPIATGSAEVRGSETEDVRVLL